MLQTSPGEREREIEKEKEKERERERKSAFRGMMTEAGKEGVKNDGSRKDASFLFLPFALWE
jgi:hypothetical protein